MAISLNLCKIIQSNINLNLHNTEEFGFISYPKLFWIANHAMYTF